MRVFPIPLTPQYFQQVFGGQPQLVGASPSFYDFLASTTTGTLPTGVTATRASAGYYNNSAGTLVSAATDVPRYTYRHNGTSWVPDGILIEGPATNLLTYSEAFDNGAWGVSGSTISANATTAPDGTLTADALVENSATSLHNVGRIPTFTSGTTYVVSVYAKADTRSWLAIYLDPARFGGAGYTYFNLSTGATGTVLAGATAFTTLEANGFYRCVVIATATGSGGGNFVFNLATGNNTVTYAGDGVSKAYIWGANLVAASALSSYIQTTSATASRAADEVRITNANALADQAWIIKARAPRKISGGAVNTVMQVDDGGPNNRRVAQIGTDNKLHVLAITAGSTQADLDMSAISNDAGFILADRFADAKFAASRDAGVIVTETTAGRINPLGGTTVRLGSSSAGEYLNATIRTVETRRTASDAELPLLAA